MPPNAMDTTTDSGTVKFWEDISNQLGLPSFKQLNDLTIQLEAYNKTLHTRDATYREESRQIEEAKLLLMVNEVIGEKAVESMGKQINDEIGGSKEVDTVQQSSAEEEHSTSENDTAKDNSISEKRELEDKTPKL